MYIINLLFINTFQLFDEKLLGCLSIFLLVPTCLSQRRASLGFLNSNWQQHSFVRKCDSALHMCWSSELLHLELICGEVSYVEPAVFQALSRPIQND